jgi:hypothetical protein
VDKKNYKSSSDFYFPKGSQTEKKGASKISKQLGEEPYKPVKNNDHSRS